MDRKIFLNLSTVLSSALISWSCAFALMKPVPFEELVNGSSHILRAKVESKISFWNDAHNFIYTRVTLKGVEAYKGGLALDSSVTVLLEGGRVNDTTLWVEDAPTFRNGEETLVFLKAAGPVYTVTAWEQGKYTVVNGQVVEKTVPLSDFAESIRKAMGK